MNEGDQLYSFTEFCTLFSQTGVRSLAYTGVDFSRCKLLSKKSVSKIVTFLRVNDRSRSRSQLVSFGKRKCVFYVNYAL